jgi:signal transduction histidine kinase
MGEIRTFMNTLEDAEANWFDLAAELRNYTQAVMEPHHIATSIDTDIDPRAATPGVFLYLTLLRIHKEALVNVIKHSRAGSVKVLFRVTPATVRLSIGDNGVGMSGAGARTGRGIANMHSRARELGAELTIASGEGTVVALEAILPIAPGNNSATATALPVPGEDS